MQPKAEEAIKRSTLTFPAGFLWGTSTAATQIEGHIDNEWSDFVARDGKTCQVACDSYHRYVEDIEWMRRLGVNTYRMGIEWSRLQLAANGPLEPAQLARYLDQVKRLNAAGITPMIVLHHFSNPNWISRQGGWTNPQTIAAFVDYATKLVRALREHVRIWNTFNEPDTYACCGFVIGHFPPRQTWRVLTFRKVIRHMAQAHQQVCRMVRDVGSGLGPVEVGFSKNWTYFVPYGRLAWDAGLAAIAHRQFNRFVLKTFFGQSEPTAATFLGLNYYGRIRFRNLKPLVPAYGISRRKLAALGIDCDDMLERHPRGLEPVLRFLQRTCQVPIYITEHGSCSEDESFRERDLKENLTAVHRSLASGVDVRGFYYWSLLDNFEWQFGYQKKFGLLSVDFNDQALPRAMKPLAGVYSDICISNALQY